MLFLIAIGLQLRGCVGILLFILVYKRKVVKLGLN
jgi:hypothetical protein